MNLLLTSNVKFSADNKLCDVESKEHLRADNKLSNVEPIDLTL